MYKINTFNNVGFLETKLPLKAIKLLNKYIKNKKENWNHNLAGQIDSSFIIEDKNNWFFKKEIIPTIEQYIKTFGKELLEKSSKKALTLEHR